MRGSLIGYTVLLLIFFSSGCAMRHHQPAPKLDHHQAWHIHCETARMDRAKPGQAQRTFDERWLFAQADNKAFTLSGQLEDGFLIADGLFHDEQDLSARLSHEQLKNLCLNTLKNRQESDQARYVLVSIFAARPHEKINVPIVFPDKHEQKITRAVVFGDSLSDQGKLKRRLKIFPDNPYWLGRFSNGPTWPEYLNSGSSITVQNRAYSGAYTIFHESMPGETFVHRLKENGQLWVSGTVTDQVNDYIAQRLYNGKMQSADNTVFILWTGANDYVSKETLSGFIDHFLNAPTGESGYQHIVDKTITASHNILEALERSGAKQIVVMGSPDLGDAPLALDNISYHNNHSSNLSRRIELSEKLSALSRYHNQQLLEMLNTFNDRHQDLNIIYLSATKNLQHVIEQTLPYSEQTFDYGFDFTTQETRLKHQGKQLTLQKKCYQGGYLGSDNHDDICQQQDQVFFWDVVHPTSFAHCWQAYMLVLEFHQQGWINLSQDHEAYKQWCRHVASKSWGLDESQWIFEKETSPDSL